MKTLLIIPLVLFAFQSSQKSEDLNSPSTGSAPNVKHESGWTSLFDGTSLNGWRPFKNQENTGWDIADSSIHCKAAGPDLITDKEYGNFEFDVDWRISKGGNSGIIYRLTEENNETYLSGPEYQLLDNEGYPDPIKTGADYDMYDPQNPVYKEPMQWNHTQIIVNGNHVEHWLNGVKVVDYDLHSADWDARKARSKWKDDAAYGAASKGHIALQDHGGHQVWFKNIRIKEL